MFRAVSNRCAVDYSGLRTPLPEQEIFTRLISLGFQVIEVDLVKMARSFVGASRYQRGATLEAAPHIFDCSSFIKWLYAQRGIWLPRRTIQQIELGSKVDLSRLIAGDVIFTTGHINYYQDDPNEGVGHVGIATGEGTVVHAADSRVGIVESELKNFLARCELRGIRRYISEAARVITLETPAKREVETSDDIRWILLQNLART